VWGALLLLLVVELGCCSETFVGFAAGGGGNGGVVGGTACGKECVFVCACVRVI